LNLPGKGGMAQPTDQVRGDLEDWEEGGDVLYTADDGTQLTQDTAKILMFCSGTH